MKIYYFRNLLDSSMLAMDQEGEIITHALYDEWGKSLTEASLDGNFAGIDNINNYTGYTYDYLLDIYFAQNRFYNPDTRQFITQNPIKDGMNWYGYCEGNPLVWVDPWGLKNIVKSPAKVGKSSITYNKLYTDIYSIGGTLTIENGRAMAYYNGVFADGAKLHGKPSNYYLNLDDYNRIMLEIYKLQLITIETRRIEAQNSADYGYLGASMGLLGQEEGTGDINDIWDDVTINRINNLHPSIRQNVVDFILDVQNKGINLRVADGYRTIAEQNALYEQGRTTPGKIVTNANGGSSYHNYGLAIDVYEIKNGQVVWDVLPQWVVDIGTGYGFEWGGYWTDPYDPPHFQMNYGYSTNDLLEKVNQGNVDEKGYVEL